MKTFYDGWLVHKLSLHAAFRRAQEVLYNDKITKRVVLQKRPLRRVEVDCSENPIYPYRSPYYWAPFVLID